MPLAEDSVAASATATGAERPANPPNGAVRVAISIGSAGRIRLIAVFGRLKFLARLAGLGFGVVETVAIGFRHRSSVSFSALVNHVYIIAPKV